MASIPADAPVSRDGGLVWRVGCQDGDCEGQELSALSFSASNAVFVRSATENERKQQEKGPGVAAFVIADGDAGSSAPVVAKVAVDAKSGLRTLFIGSFSSKSGGNPNFEVVLMTPNTIQRVDLAGSGNVTVDDHVLAEEDEVSLSASGSGVLIVSSTDTMHLTRLDIKTEGSGDVQIALNEIHADDLQVAISGSGHVALFTNYVRVESEALVTSDASGDLCWEGGANLGIEKLEIAQMSTGDISITSKPRTAAICGHVDIKAVGSGNVDVSSVHCRSGSVVTFGSSDVTVQVSESLTGQIIGSSGSIRYAGSAPRTVDHSYFGGAIASSVQPSYKTPVCLQRAFPVPSHSRSVLIDPSIDAPVNVVKSINPTPPNDDRHLDALLPLGAVALIAALILWKFNSSRAQQRQQTGWSSSAALRHVGSSKKSEEQPLVNDHGPVYI